MVWRRTNCKDTKNQKWPRWRSATDTAQLNDDEHMIPTTALNAIFNDAYRKVLTEIYGPNFKANKVVIATPTIYKLLAKNDLA